MEAGVRRMCASGGGKGELQGRAWQLQGPGEHGLGLAHARERAPDRTRVDTHGEVGGWVSIRHSLPPKGTLSCCFLACYRHLSCLCTAKGPIKVCMPAVEGWQPLARDRRTLPMRCNRLVQVLM